MTDAQLLRGAAAPALPQGTAALLPTISMRWDRAPADGAGLSIERLRITQRVAVDTLFDVEFVLAFRGDAFAPTESAIELHTPADPAPGRTLLAAGRPAGALVARWREPLLNAWLGALLPGFADGAQPPLTEVTLRAIDTAGRRELRLDWTLAGERSFELPGITIAAAGAPRLSLVLLAAGGRELNRAALVATLDKNAELRAGTTFAWERALGDVVDRELHNRADGAKADDEPLIALKVRPAGDLSLVPCFAYLDQPKLPKFFRRLGAGLAPIALDTAPADAPIAESGLLGLSAEVLADGYPQLTLNLDSLGAGDDGTGARGFTLPILKDDELNQRVALFAAGTITPVLNNGEIEGLEVPFGVVVTFGSGSEDSFALRGELRLTFRLDTLALKVNHELGIAIVAENEETKKEFLGLTWTFKGAAIAEDGPNKGKYLLLTLATRDSNYQIQQPEGAEFSVTYGGISDRELGFKVTDFALSPRGLSVTTEVIDQPVKLNGLDTKFRFDGSGFSIVDNELRAFTLAGSGPLPPDLVGEAIADIALQFELDGRKLRLVAGSASLKGTNLLKAKSTRFEFAIDAIGVKFVDDGKFHLYFTLTGSAEFKLADGDEAEGLLSWLPGVKLELVEAPLAGDSKALMEHVNFKVELPEKKSFSLLGCFEFELRALAFFPRFEKFDGPAMMLSGQIKFAQGAGDKLNAQIDFHELYIGLPRPGSFFPRVYLPELGVSLSFGEAFKLEGTVEFRDTDQEKGFLGEGLIEIKGLPTMAAAFAFLRVRRDADGAWVRAWFIYLEVRKVTLQIPVVQLYLREVGLGFGYRYTIASIKAADEAGSLAELMKSLDELSRTQGDLSKRDRWAVDIEDPDEALRWTIVLRAMISQTGASPVIKYNELAEAVLPCVYLLDAVISFRSDLTFFMVARGWINTNYNDYLLDTDGLREAPLLSGYIFLSVRQRRLLARLVSNPEGSFGVRPPFPDFVRQALKVQFSATLLLEPGLLHFELGWPNMLRWSLAIGPMLVEQRGGFIYRVSMRELVIGVSFMARGRLEISAGFNAKVVGARITALAELAYGARFIGVLDFASPAGRSAFYGAVGLSMMIRISLEVWIKFLFIKKTWRLSMSLSFSAGLEVGLMGTSPGVRGAGTLALSFMGRSLRFSVKVGFNEGAVGDALARTAAFLNIGLEAAEVDPVPGLPQGGALGAAPLLEARAEVLRGQLAERVVVLGEGADAPFAAPNYAVFVIRRADGWSYALILPAGEDDERGFLPVPPAAGVAVARDFVMALPGAQDGLALEQFDPASDRWTARGPGEWGWNVDWDARVLPADAVPPVSDAALEEEGAAAAAAEEGERLKTLRGYLGYAFRADAAGNLVGDPAVIPGVERRLADERVANPTDDAFEAAVRGAAEQFRGSPFFKFDPDYEYDRALAGAFRPDTTIYRADGSTDEDAPDPEVLELQRVDQLRGVIVQDLVADVRDFVRRFADADPAAGAELGGEARGAAGESIAFQMGLVFRFKGEPAWLTKPVPAEQAPTIRQRLDPTKGDPDGAPARAVRVFNTADTSFAAHPPTFAGVRQFSDATTIAIAWDLTWDHITAGDGHTPAQADPEQHLAHYRVLRRPLDSNEPDLVYTVKGADVLHRELEGETSVLKRLRPRFQVVDNFGAETLEDQAALPPEGRSYLYSITPVDAAGNAGRPLSLVATRYPSEPPAVPADATLTARYSLGADDRRPTAAPELLLRFATAVTPDNPGIELEWSEPAGGRGADVAIAHYRLIFRRDRTLPIGSYALDSTTEGDRVTVLPTSNARPLPTDVKLSFERAAVELSPEGRQGVRRLAVSLAALRDAGVLPADGGWRPEAWQIFIQTVAVNNVPSALAPVQVRLVVRAAGRPDEERRPDQLEWLPRPFTMPLLPPEDQSAAVGEAHVPMPTTDQALDLAKLDLGAAIQYRRHPAGIRGLRFRWNQGPSAAATYPLDLTAGYQLLELDVDAHTTATFASAERLALALRQIQEVRMLPGDELALDPGDTLAASQWEAWYPSAVARRKAPGERPAGSELSAAPWYSWRESLLEWPAWPGLTPEPFKDDPSLVVAGKAGRTTNLHPFLQALLDDLAASERFALEPSSADLAALVADLDRGRMPALLRESFAARDIALPAEVAVSVRAGGSAWLVRDQAARRGFTLRRDGGTLAVAELSGLVVDRQAVPPVQAGTLEEFLKVTAPKNDPYGWGVLQQFGLSTAFALRRESSGKPVGGQAQLEALALALGRVVARLGAGMLRHLHVELLYQPGRSVEYAEAPAPPDALLAVVQLSLRPAVRQLLRYGVVDIGGPAGAELDVKLSFKAGPGSAAEATAVDQSDPARGEIALRRPEQAGKPALLYVKLPSSGRARVLLRCADELAVEVAPRDARVALDVSTSFAGGVGEPAAYFTAPKTLARDSRPAPVGVFGGVAFAGGDLARQWLALKAYLGAVNSQAASPNIALPDAEDAIARALPDVLAWAQRFFDHGPAGLAGGPWLATAYPRAVMPAYAAPDAGGRLTYDHLIPDRWAHAYRYYLRPYGRYDQLWASLLRAAPAVALPRADAGALDVVVDRVKPVSMPTVISSRRLDEPSQPGRPAAPGATWEVIVAQHPEQALVERNQTLVRRLAYRQIAFAMERRFAYDEWVALLGFDRGRLSTAADRYPAIPRANPAAPDHLVLADLERIERIAAGDELPELSADARAAIVAALRSARRSLDLPARVGSFQQGVMALQWEGLPFYYEHRLSLIAQTSTTVSPVNAITQRDFEYRAPTPEGVMAGAVDQDAGRVRRVTMPLRSFWDSLPASAQGGWPSENPAELDTTGRRSLSSLPDPDVIYQIVESFNGNVEVQLEIFVNFQEAAGGPVRGAHVVRQIGKRWTAAGLTRTAPAANTADPFMLVANLLQRTETPLSKPYAVSRPGITFEGNTLVVRGVFSPADRDALRAVITDAADRRAVDALYESWFSREALSRPYAAAELPAALRGLVELPEPTDCTLVWEGAMSADEAAAVRALPGDASFKAALERLARAALAAGAGTITVEQALLGADQLPAALAGKVELGVATAPGEPARYNALTWVGLMDDRQRDDLLRWAQIPELGAAARAVVAALDARALEQTVPPARPRQGDMPASLGGKLVLSDRTPRWRAPQPPADGTLRWAGFAPTADERVALYSLRDTGGAPADQAFKIAMRDLIIKFDAGAETGLAPVSDLDMGRVLPLTPSLADRIKAPAQGRLVWERTIPNATQDVELRRLLADPAYRPQLAEGVRTLIDALAGVRVGVAAGTAAPEGVPPALGIAGTAMSWNKASLTTVERLQLLALRDGTQGTGEFRRAVGALLVQLEGGTLQSRPVGAGLRVPGDVFASLKTRLSVTQSGDALAWSKGLPDDDTLADLRRLADRVAVAQALPGLLAALEAAKVVPLPVGPKRPYQDEVDGTAGAGKLTVTPTGVRWHGRVEKVEQLRLLQDLADDPTLDRDFSSAIGRIRAELEQHRETAEIAPAVELRPTYEELAARPDGLAAGLLIGRASMRFHGLMTADEGEALRAALQARPLDARAAERLYAATLARGMQGRELQVRARRGSAPPSPAVALAVEPLAVAAQPELKRS